MTQILSTPQQAVLENEDQPLLLTLRSHIIVENATDLFQSTGHTIFFNACGTKDHILLKQLIEAGLAGFIIDKNTNLSVFKESTESFEFIYRITDQSAPARPPEIKPDDSFSFCIANPNFDIPSLKSEDIIFLHMGIESQQEPEGLSLEEALKLYWNLQKAEIKVGFYSQTSRGRSGYSEHIDALMQIDHITNQTDITCAGLILGGQYVLAPSLEDMTKELDQLDKLIDQIDTSSTAIIGFEASEQILRKTGSMIVQILGRQEATLMFEKRVIDILNRIGPEVLQKPVRLIKAKQKGVGKPTDFHFACLPDEDNPPAPMGPFVLPESVVTGDWIEILDMAGFYQNFKQDVDLEADLPPEILELQDTPEERYYKEQEIKEEYERKEKLELQAKRRKQLQKRLQALNHPS